MKNSQTFWFAPRSADRKGGGRRAAPEAPQSDGELETVERQRPKEKHPKQYKVFLINDDYTSMDFVVSVLESIFRKSPAEAVQVMLSVHKSGQGLCGIYARQIAEAKIQAVHDRARGAGYPLRCLMEEE